MRFLLKFDQVYTKFLLHHKQAAFKFVIEVCHFYTMCCLLPLLSTSWADKGEFAASKHPSPHPPAAPAWALDDINTTGSEMET